MPDTLNLGCGKAILPGAVNHDIRRHRPGIDVAHDLNVLPWPWENEVFDHIVAQSVLEHLRITLIESVDECWRLLRTGGTLDVRIPWWESDLAYRDPAHYWRFSLGTLDIFDPDSDYGREYDFYTERKWRFLRRPELSRHKTAITALMQVCK
jgi:SAM-dependent methyltransferase